MFGKLFMLALVVLGVMMAVPRTRAMLVEKANPYIDDLRGKVVPSRLEAMADQLEARVNRGEGFPASWDGWLKRSYSGVPEDPWGRIYFLNVGRRDFTVGSVGPDGQRGTDDDITLTRRLGG